MGYFPMWANGMWETLIEGFGKEVSIFFHGCYQKSSLLSLPSGNEGASSFGCCWQDHTAALKAGSFQMKLTPWGRTERPKASKQMKTTQSKWIRPGWAFVPIYLEQFYHRHGPIDSFYCLSQSESCFLFCSRDHPSS